MSLLNVSIVLYNNEKSQLKKIIKTFLDIDLDIILYLVDNSNNDDLKELASMDNRIMYIFNNVNLGYGTAHNIAMQKSIEENVPYHLVLNPDIYFENGVIEELFKYMEMNDNIGNIMPRVLYPDGKIQYLCKLLPTPIDLIFRRFIPFKKLKEKRNKQYELHFTGYNQIMHVPNLSGCFMFLRTSALQEVGLFDENIFMYLEDVDLNRRLGKKYKTIFYPDVHITHEYAKESYKNRKLLKYHIQSAVYYFNKWGWFFDKERKTINNKILSPIIP